ncbi:MAG: hypothetical protein KGL53_14180 [Elusimicrobia bacterium]|nr:hypothetical protein [Elusimicrobiota bacterium]
MRRAFVALAVLGSLAACAPHESIRRESPVTATETEHAVSEYVGPKRRIGVVDFENKTKYGQRLGDVASDILVTELTKTGRFVVVERDKLDKIMAEQKLQSSGAIDPRTAVKMGKILGLNAIVTGAVSEFGVKTEGSDYLLVQSKRETAEATVDVRVVDAETGQVLLADSGQGVAKSGKGSFLGLGTKGGYDETLEGKALRAAIVQFTDNIVSQLSKKPWSCRIAGVNGDTVYLNAGPTMGVNKGLKLDCFHMGREITDPTTGLVIGNEETPIGRLEVTGALGDSGDGATGRFISQPGPNPEPKDICRLKD